jgi:hypothetical protein
MLPERTVTDAAAACFNNARETPGRPDDLSPGIFKDVMPGIRQLNNSRFGKTAFELG